MIIEFIGTLIQIVSVLLIAYVAYSFVNHRADNSLFKELARRHGGKIINRWWLQFPQLTLDYKHHKMELAIRRSTKTGATSHLNFNVSSSGKWSILPNNTFEQFGTKLGLQDVKLGNNTFDTEYLVKAKIVNDARSMITPALQESLLNIRDMSPEISCWESTIRIKVPELTQIELYEKLLAIGFKFIDELD